MPNFRLSALAPALVPACVAMTLTATAAPAQVMIDGSDPEAIADVLRGYGAASLDTGADGDPLVRGRIDGDGYTVHFYGCRAGKSCRSVQFVAAWAMDRKPDLAAINDWNLKKRFGKAYLDDEGDPVIEMDVNLDFGVTRRNFDDTAEYWQIILREFRDEVVRR